MSSQYIQLPTSGGSGEGAVDSVNGLTGIVVLTKANIGLPNVNNTADVDKPVSTAQAAADLDVQNFSIDRANHVGTQNIDTIIGNFYSVWGGDSSGNGYSIPSLQIDSITGGVRASGYVQADDVGGSYPLNNNSLQVAPISNSPTDLYLAVQNAVYIDVDNNGFDLGVGGVAAQISNNYFRHVGKSNIGSLQFSNNYFDLGNGTDPITVNGFGYSFGFGQIYDNVTIDGAMQGYGFQFNVASGATLTSNSYTQAFYDAANIAVKVPSYTSFSSTPNLEQIANNSGYNGLNINPTITSFEGNAGVNGIGIYGNYGAFNTGGFNAINIAPNIDSVGYAVGVNVSMDGVTVTPGSIASLVIQDLTISTLQPSGENYYVQYVGGATAGSEVVSVVGPSTIQVQIEDGVSTATQVKDALEAFISFVANFTVTISGTASNPQVVQSSTMLTGGAWPGAKKAAYFGGDVEVAGSLTFQGELSIARLNAFDDLAVVSGGGAPASVHQLISAPTVGDNETLTNADTFGVNTAMLLSIGENSTVTTSLVGLSAMALPAVVSMKSGSTVDSISGGTFAISLDPSATGGTITNVDLCKAIAIPNGVTMVTNLRGFKFDIPFGDPGSTTWGFYAQSGHNYFGGDLKLGAGSDTATNSDIALEVEDRLAVLGRGDTATRDTKAAINGALWYNTQTHKFQGYANGNWADLH